MKPTKQEQPSKNEQLGYFEGAKKQGYKVTGKNKMTHKEKQQFFKTEIESGKEFFEKEMRPSMHAK